MAATVLERASDLRSFVTSLAALRDPVGVLSITTGIEPGVMGGRTPAWEIALENDLTRLRQDEAFGRKVALRAKEASERIEELLDPTTSGRGRALYLALESGEARNVILHGQLPTGARVGPVAHLLPLLAALDEGEPAGLLAASRDTISISERELGRVRHLDPMELEPWIGDWWPEMKGPARANPQRGQQTVSQRDAYERRVAAAYRRTLDSATRAIATLAGERDWTRVVVAGDPRLSGALELALRERGLATTTIDANLEGVRPEDAYRRLEAALDAMIDAHRLERARLAVEEAAAGAHGACGLDAILGALAEGRVAELLIDSSGTFVGLVDPGEVLRAGDEDSSATVAITDLMVVRALSTDAKVIALAGFVAELLADCGGIAAILRW
jgi:hypothetical protein